MPQGIVSQPLSYTGVAAINPLDTVVAPRAPLTTDINYPIGTPWVNTVGLTTFELVSVASNIATWNQTSGGTSVIDNVVGTANQITSVVSASVATLSIPATFIAPGSIASTTTLTGGTGITATTGNIAASAGNVTATGLVSAGTSVAAGTTVTGGTGVIATTGNFTASASGAGLFLVSPTASGAASSPLVLNGRSGRAVFTTVSIAAAADLTLTITNSAITASTTDVLYSLSGATTGSALSIKSITNSAGSSAIVVTNGTGASTSTSNITLVFLVLNA